MRSDALGLWWRDEPIIKVKKEVIKRTPPKPVWLQPDYLPGLEEALQFNVPVMNDSQLFEARTRRERLLFDIEIYANYFLASFASLNTGAVAYVEMTPDYALNNDKLAWILQNFTVVSFNGNHFDMPLTCMALSGKSCNLIKEAANKIIIEEWRGSDVLKAYRVKNLLKNCDHIDLIEVAPSRASLKTYGGRLHTPRMQDLPFHHAAVLSPQQMAIVRWYCVNDLTHTGFLYESLKEQLSLRESMSREYGIDLRSKSDAQIAEAVIADGVWKLNRERPQKPIIPVGTVYKYQVPHFIKYETSLMNWALGVVAQAPFIVADHGSIEMPAQVDALRITIAGNTYKMGIGGLHSTEERVAYVADENTVITDRDVTSYYPQIILNQQLYPQHLGRAFLRVYQQIVDRRVQAKQRGDKVIADSLKITVNGSFGKLGSKYSILYSPDLLMQTTLTGQLALLMLIECLELRGIQVISANTDGVVIRCPKMRMQELEFYIKAWEQQTGFITEDTRYSAYYARDVNSYIAVKQKFDKQTKAWLKEVDGAKMKGAYAPTGLQKNPTNRICVDAVESLLTKNVPIVETIRNCKDIRKFVSVRKAKGGAVKVYGDSTEYLGVSLRWYYATGVSGEIVYASSGNKVPRSDGAKPLMKLPKELPDDIDFEWYEREAAKILREIAYFAD